MTTLHGPTPRYTGVYDAVREAATSATPAVPITYTPLSVGLDSHRFTIEQVSTLRSFVDDERTESAAAADLPFVEVELLRLSPHWEDRIRARAVLASLNEDITLPDDFPCIYEPAESPNMARALRPRPTAWVISPDMDMLEKLLPLYRELWRAYEDQWPHSPNREFAVGRLNGLTPHRVYRPGTTAADVIGATMITHDGMYARAPEHLRRMHPLHAQWEAARSKTRAQFHAHRP